MAIEVPAWLALWAEGELEVDDRVVATLHVSSGRVAACDPLVGRRLAKPFARAVPPGDHRVVLGRAQGDVVLAALRIAEGQVASWELALLPGERPGEAPRGYPVDSGTGCFVDGEAAGRGLDLGDEIVSALGRQGFASLPVEPGSAENLVAFPSGAGDGAYPSWWGLDREGRPLWLVTDFGLIEVDDEEVDDEEVDGEDLDDEEVDDGPLGDEQLRGLLAELAAEGDEAPEAETPHAPVSPVFLRVRTLIDRWEEAGKIELVEDCDREGLAEALLEVLDKLEGHRRVGAHLAEWLMERPEVEDLFASDADLESDLRG